MDRFFKPLLTNDHPAFLIFAFNRYKILIYNDLNNPFAKKILKLYNLRLTQNFMVKLWHAWANKVNEEQCPTADAEQSLLKQDLKKTS